MTVTLTGIDARNPCGYLAALGTLRVIDDHLGEQRVLMSWAEGSAGSWNPVLDTGTAMGEEELCRAVVDAHEQRDVRRELGWDKDVMKVPVEEAERLLSADETRVAGMAAGCIVDIPRRQGRDVHPERLAAYTPLRLIPRVGRARFLDTGLKLSEALLDERRVRVALLGPWEYSKSNSLRWDPGAKLPLRAYGAEAPTNFGPLGVPAATALAVAGLCFFPLMFNRGSATCRGFASPRSRALALPVWSPPMDEAAVRTTLSLPALHPAPQTPVDHRQLRRHGVVARVVTRRASIGTDDYMFAWGELERTDRV